MHLHSRRAFLAVGASLLEQAIVRAAEARAQSATAPANLFDIEKVAGGIYAAVAKPTAIVNCNAAIFENTSDLLIVDTHSKGSAVAALVAQIRKEVTTKPVRYVVNTHFHGDHVQGNTAYRKIAPHAAFVASTVTYDLMAEVGAERLKATAGQVEKGLDDFLQQLARAKTAEEKAYSERRISECRAYLAEMRNGGLELPDVTFDRSLTLRDKAHTLHLLFRGRAHTAGDIVMFCPEKKVIATGDMLHSMLPYAADGYPREWPATLRSAGELAFDQVIGGHGNVQHTRKRLPQMADYIEELAAAVVRGKDRGLTVEQLQSEITPATLKSLASGGYGDFVGEQMARFDDGFERKTPAALVAAGVKANVAATLKALERS